MKKILKIGAIIYNIFLDRNQDIPYARTVVTVSFLLFLHICQVAFLFNIDPQYVLGWSASERKHIQWIKASLFFIVLSIIVIAIFSKKE